MRWLVIAAIAACGACGGSTTTGPAMPQQVTCSGGAKNIANQWPPQSISSCKR